MGRDYEVITFIPKYWHFPDIIKIITMFIKNIFKKKIQEKLKELEIMH